MPLYKLDLNDSVHLDAKREFSASLPNLSPLPFLASARPTTTSNATVGHRGNGALRGPSISAQIMSMGLPQQSSHLAGMGRNKLTFSSSSDDNSPITAQGSHQHQHQHSSVTSDVLHFFAGPAVQQKIKVDRRSDSHDLSFFQPLSQGELDLNKIPIPADRCAEVVLACDRYAIVMQSLLLRALCSSSIPYPEILVFSLTRK